MGPVIGAVWEEYTRIAERSAAGEGLDAMRPEISDSCWRRIIHDIGAFAAHVNACAYAHAMGKIHAKYGED